MSYRVYRESLFLECNAKNYVPITRFSYAKFSGVIQSQWFNSNIHGILDMMNNFKYEMENKQPPEKTALLITK